MQNGIKPPPRYSNEFCAGAGQHLRLEFEKIKDQLNPSERQRKENVITSKFLIAFVIIFGIFAVIAVIELAFKAVLEV